MPPRGIDCEVFEQRRDELMKANPKVDFTQLVTQMVKVPGRGLVKCVMIPMLKQGELDVDVEAATQVAKEEQLDDGKMCYARSSRLFCMIRLQSPSPARSEARRQLDLCGSSSQAVALTGSTQCSCASRSCTP